MCLKKSKISSMLSTSNMAQYLTVALRMGKIDFLGTLKVWKVIYGVLKASKLCLTYIDMSQTNSESSCFLVFPSGASPLCVCLAHPLTLSILVSLSVWCVPPSVSVCGSQMIVSLSVQCVPPKNLASSSLQDGFDLAHSTWISSVALPA